MLIPIYVFFKAVPSLTCLALGSQSNHGEGLDKTFGSPDHLVSKILESMGTTKQNPSLRLVPQRFLAREAVLDAIAKDESGAFSSDTKNAIDEYQIWAVLPANMSVCLLQVMHVSRNRRGDKPRII